MTHKNTSLYSGLVAHYNGRRDKAALCRVWGRGWAVGMDGDDIVLGGSKWESPTTSRGQHKRTSISTPLVRVTPDSVVSLIKHSHGQESAPWVPYRYHANLLMEVINVWKGTVRSVASDPLHTGPAMTARVDGNIVGLDEHFTYQGWRYDENGTYLKGHVLTSTPLGRRRTDRKAAKFAYKLSRQVAEIAAMSERFKDRKDETAWVIISEAKVQLPLKCAALFEAAGNTFDLKCEDHPDLVAALADTVGTIAYYQLDYNTRRNRPPGMYDTMAAYGRGKLLHQMKKLEGYVE